MRALLLVTALAACASSRPAPTPPPPADPTIAPRPFTAEQIRDAMPTGTQIQLRMVEPPNPAVFLRLRVTAADARAVTIATQIVGEDGTLIKDAGLETTAWSDLLKHATFPAAATTRTESSVSVPAGTYDSIDYVVRDGGSVKTYHFARSLPGPPVLLIEEKDGVLVRRMELVARTRVTTP